jgi:iron complex outermembrane receptor protein
MKQLTSRKALMLCATMLAGLSASPTLAQTTSSNVGVKDDTSVGEIVVTANRRSGTVQDSPINISAVSGASIENLRLDDVKSLAAFTPGVTVTDTGPGSSGNIIMRGISSGDTSATGSNSNSSVGVYLGEVPLYLDFKLIDIQRVEALQGPQGTLYGLGTLAGAIRYIPNRPDLDTYSTDVNARSFGESHSGSAGADGDITFNVPIVKDHVAFRSVVGFYDNPGFIDYNHLLANPGVSIAQPVLATTTTNGVTKPSSTTPGNAPAGSTTTLGSFGTPAQQAANFTQDKDANFEHTFTTRNQLLLEYSPDLLGYFTFAHQATTTDGKQTNGDGVLGTSNYSNPDRYLDTSDRGSDLFSAELEAQLGHIAKFYSTTAFTRQTLKATTDNTDLLLDLNYGYEAFPAFSSFANNESHTKQFNQEFRLVSTHGGPFSWVLGGFYNRLTNDSQRQEYTPGYAEFAGINRPDELEYISKVDSKTAEKAVYGEGTYHITQAWQVTGGFRYFDYNSSVNGGSDTPLFGKGLIRMPYPSTTIAASQFRAGSTKGDGPVWKANTSYQFTPDFLAYFTYSTGYRVGGVNRVVPCILPLPKGQNLCALPNELSYKPDKTKNMEVGLRGTMFDKRFQWNVDGYNVNWDNVQVPGQTINGAIGITKNGATAVSRGADVSGSFKVTKRFLLMATYSYDDAHLTADVPGLVVSHKQMFEALSGDRLPGSTKNSATFQAQYTYPLDDSRDVQAIWATTYTGDIYSRTGLLGFGTDIPGYAVSRVSLTYRTPKYNLGLFADNIFDKYAVTSVSNDQSSINLSRTGVTERYYQQSVLTPFRAGVQLSYHF